MCGRLRINIAESSQLIRFVYQFTWNFAFDDFAKDTIWVRLSSVVGI